MSISEKNIRNVFYYTIPNFVHYGLNFISLPILTRLLNPDDFGVAALTMAVPPIAVGVLTFGAVASVPRYYFEFRKEEHKLNMLYFSMQVYLFVMLAFSAVIVYVFKHDIARLITGTPQYGMAFFVAFLTLYIGQMNIIYLRIYQNREEAIHHTVFVLIQGVTSPIASLLFVWYFKLSYMGLLWGFLVGAVAAWIPTIIHFNRGREYVFNKHILLENMKYGIQIIPKSFTGFINKFFDKYMLNNMLSMSVVGVFSIGQQIAHVFDLVMDKLFMSLQPVYFRAVFDRGNLASKETGRIFTVFFYVSVFVIILGILFAREILYVIAPASYQGAIKVVVILAAGITTQTFGKYVSVQYAYKKKPIWVLPVSVIGTIINVGLNIVLIPRYGLIGAAYATVFSMVIMNIALVMIGQRLYKIDYEWRAILFLYAIVIMAIAYELYFRVFIHNLMHSVLLRMIVILLYILIGIKIGLLSQRGVKKVVHAFMVFKRANVVEKFEGNAN
ncbi:oligosaccharide flippase family protein [Fibrobacterota bacterium]